MHTNGEKLKDAIRSWDGGYIRGAGNVMFLELGASDARVFLL